MHIYMKPALSLVPPMGETLENSFLGPTKRNCEKWSKLLWYYTIFYVCSFKGCFRIHSISFNLRDENSYLHNPHTWIFPLSDTDLSVFCSSQVWMSFLTAEMLNSRSYENQQMSRKPDREWRDEFLFTPEPLSPRCFCIYNQKGQRMC